MATQGQRRTEAKNAIRKLRVGYRAADSAGEKVERELDRLIKRKTLIGPDQIAKVSQQIADYVRLVEALQRLYAMVYELVLYVPR